ncbi:MAG: hypothetical protein ACKVVT_07715 [Dehalococcoidia bacterium]
MTAEPTTRCRVCLEEVPADQEAWCGQCGALYHLAQRLDRPGKDCGSVWINEDHLALDFTCNVCLNPEPQASLDDVLDLDEAAVAAQMAPDALRGLADGGSVRHRKTGAGVYLFVRKDIQALRG